MSRRLVDGGRTSFKESKLWKFIEPDLGAWCLLTGELIIGGLALYLDFSRPYYSIDKSPRIESSEKLYATPIAYDFGIK